MNTAVLFVLFASVALAGESAADLSERALALARQHRNDQAAQLWRQALSIAPDYFPALFNLGYMLSAEGRPAEARPWLERAARVDPKDFNAHYLLGAVLVELGERDPALVQWRAALAIQPSNEKLMDVMIVEYEKGLYYGEAEALAIRALELNPTRLDSYLLAIHACQNARDLARGLDVARRAAEQFPESARANFEYGFHLRHAGRPAEAARYLKKAMDLDPGYEEPFFFYGDLLMGEGRNAEAIPYLRKAIANRADYLAPRLSLAQALVHLERWNEAKEELQQAVRIEPNHPEPHLLLSRIYFREGDQRAAANEKQIALRLRRENPHALEAVQGRPFPK